MNILYLTDTGNIIGGGEISLLNLFENIDRQRFKPYLFVPFEGNLSRKARDLDVAVSIMQLKKVKNLLNIFYSINTISKLCDIIKEYQIDLVHSNSTGGITFLGSIAARICGIPFIWHVRIIESAGILDWIQSLLVDKIVVISKAVRQRFWWIINKNKITLIYNGVNLQKFSLTMDKMIFRREIGCRQDEFLVGTIGRYHPVKGYEYFIKAAKIVLQELTNVKFLIVGLNYRPDNRYLNHLRILTRDLNLEDKIIFMPERDDIAEILNSLDLFVLPSLKEPFGRVLIEAMASGKPIVASASGGALEIVEDVKTGFLVRPRDFKAIAEKIVYLLKNKDIREEFGKNGRMRAEILFDIKSHTKNIESLYLELS